jgi:L-tyrosine isonitrile synthase
MWNQNLWIADDEILSSLGKDQRLEVAASAADRGRHRRSGDIGIGTRPGRPAHFRSAQVSQPKKIDPQKVMRSFNTWAFKREQPSDPQMMLQTVANAVATLAPISFVMYWGKGPRCQIDAPDIACLDHLAAFAQRVRVAYEPGAAITLILTDTHAELNGHTSQNIRQYFTDIEEGARQRGFANCWLGELVRTAGAAPANDPSTDEFVPADMLQHLTVSAKKWFRGDGNVEQGARKYYRMNMIERRAVELAYPNAIFATFNGSKSRRLFPQNLPIFYMYSLRRGMSVKPWFLSGELAPPIAPAQRDIASA